MSNRAVASLAIASDHREAHFAGTTLKIDHGEGMYRVRFNNGSEWLTEMFLELISESR